MAEMAEMADMMYEKWRYSAFLNIHKNKPCHSKWQGCVISA
jgi:hypothetical protein